MNNYANKYDKCPCVQEIIQLRWMRNYLVFILGQA